MNKRYNIVFLLLAAILLLTCLFGCNDSKAIISYYNLKIENNDNGIIEDHYYKIDKIDYTEHASKYSVSAFASEEYVALYNKSTRIETLPVFGPYLEETSLVSYLFYEDDALIGVKTLDVNENAEFETIIKELKADAKADEYTIKRLSDEACKNALIECDKYYPDFKTEGLIFNDSKSYPGIYPVGIDKNTDHIQYVYGTELMDFRLIDQCNTLEDVRSAFENYFIDRSKIISEIPIYTFTNSKNTEIDSTELNNMYTGVRAYLGKTGEISNGSDYSGLMNDTEYVLEIPVLDKNGDENKYVLILFYQHNNLIAEIVAESNYISEEGVKLPVSENIAEKSIVDNKYESLKKPYYESVIRDYKDSHQGKMPDKVYFNGDGFVAG